jgi:glycosyltransferase involved in cell wall biosynthesis
MTDVIRTFRPDVVHSHVVTGLSGSVLAVPSELGVAHVHTLHDYWLLCQRSSLTRRDGTACEVRCVGCRVVTGMRRSVIARHPPGVITAVSHAIADEHRSVPWIAERLRVVPNPSDPAPRAEIPHGPHVVFGYVGRLTVEKGVRTLLDAFAVARVEGARLLVAGDGPLRAELEATATPGVEMLGWLDTAARERMLAEIDALVVPSEYRDPAPLVVGEARARGIPVIGARIGGIPELVSPHSAPLLFAPGDVRELAERLTHFARTPTVFVAEDDPTGLMTWEGHLDLMERAYDDAAIAVGSPKP